MKENRNVSPFLRDARKNKQGDGEDLSSFALVQAAVPPDFVARVMRGLSRTEPRREVDRRKELGVLWKWAAALLIFSAALGYGFSIGEETAESVASVSSVPQDSIASLAGSL